MSSSIATTPRRPAPPDAAAPGPLVVRATGGAGQGVGHVARGLALAEAWQVAQGTAQLLVDPAMASRARAMSAGRGIDIVTDPVPPEGAWVGLDGYDLTDAHALGVPVERRLRIDDLGRSGEARASVIVDQDPAASRSHYPGAPAGATRLLGGRYALLRPRAVPDRDPAAPPRRLVVILGGDPTAEVVAVVADTLDRLTAVASVDVDVLGGGDLVPLRHRPRVTVHGFVPDLGPWLDQADVALAASGTTTWELCRLGIPSVVWATVDNQEPVARAAAAAGAVLHAEADAGALAEAVRRVLGDPDLRVALATEARRAVDGCGAERVVVAIRSRDVTLRPAGPEDRDLLLAWANDPATRAASFDRRPIIAGGHDPWFRGRLADPDSRLFIAHDARGPWGLVRFQVIGATAEIGVSVASERRGAGLAAPLIRAGVRRLFGERPDVAVVESRIRPDNRTSARAFDRAAFAPTPDEDPIRLTAEVTDGW